MRHELTNGEDRIVLRDADGGHRMDGILDARPAAGGESPAGSISAAFVRSIIRDRAIRGQFFDQHLFSDPAWGILLELFAVRCEGTRVSVSKLSVAAGLPCTTVLRWLDKLQSERLIVRAQDPLDRRRVWVDLSELGSTAMRNYFEEISNPDPAI